MLPLKKPELGMKRRRPQPRPDEEGRRPSSD